MRANQANYPIATTCRVLGVSTSGYYAWLKHQSLQRSREDAILTDRIRWIHLRSRGTSGSPRIHAELRDEGVHMGRKRVARMIPKDTGTVCEQPACRVSVDVRALEHQYDSLVRSGLLIW